MAGTYENMNTRLSFKFKEGDISRISSVQHVSLANTSTQMDNFAQVLDPLFVVTPTSHGVTSTADLIHSE